MLMMNGSMWSAYQDLQLAESLVVKAARDVLAGKPDGMEFLTAAVKAVDMARDLCAKELNKAEEERAAEEFGRTTPGGVSGNPETEL